MRNWLAVVAARAISQTTSTPSGTTACFFERVRKRSDFDPKWSRFTITYRAVDTLLANTSATEERTIVGTEPPPWANESLRITLDPAVFYCTKASGECRYSASASRLAHGAAKRTQAIDQVYLAAYEKVAQNRIRLAGFRLAHLLNLALDPAYTQPHADPPINQHDTGVSP